MIRFEIVIDKRTKKKSGKYPLKLRVTNYNEVRFISLSIDYTEAQYNLIFKKTPIGVLLDHRNSAERKLQRAIRISQNLKPFDYKKFKELFLKNEESEIKASEYISDLFDRVIERKKSQGAIKTAINYKSSKNSLNKFKPLLRVEDVTKQFLHSYEEWYIKSRPNSSLTTVNIYLRNLRAIINEVKSQNKLPVGYVYPFGKHNYVIPESRKLKTTLTREEIIKLINYTDFETNSEMYARDIWLLQFYCNGINLKDLVKLRWDNKIGNCFVIQREKTKRTSRVNPHPIRIPINEKLKLLLDKIGKKDSPFVLGLLKDGFTESQLLNSKERFGKMVNKDLEKLFTKLNLSVPLKTKTARDAYATSLKKGNVSIEKIAEMLGQTSTAVTRRYLDSFELDEVHRINNILP